MENKKHESIYKKLQKCRVKLQATEMKKSGHNKFAGYTYFELGDFLPVIQSIFAEENMCGVVSFDKEIATLTIHDCDSDKTIVFTSPMADASLKGCHPIQNLGAVETYQRRYLYMSALEIVEHDAIDSTRAEESKPVTTTSKNASQKDENIVIDECMAALSNAPDLQGLITVWSTIPAKHRALLTPLKDQLKAQLSTTVE